MGCAPTDAGTTEECQLEVVDAYRWVGDPRRGRFKVYIDGRAAGWAPLHGSLRLSIQPGRHSVRVRLWWYTSATVGIDVHPGQTTRLDADIQRELSGLRRMLRMCFRPFRSLSLVTPSHSSIEEAE